MTPLQINQMAQVIAGIIVIVSLILAWKQYKYQKMESTIKADKQIEQNESIIKILREIEVKIK